MAETSLGMCRLEDAVAHARKARELAEGAGAAMAAVQGLALPRFRGKHARSRCDRGRASGVRALGHERCFGELAADDPWLFCIPATRFDEAEALFEQEIVWARERGLESVEVVARAHLAETQLRAGRWQEGLANARVALERARQAADAQVVTGINYALAMLEASVGHHDEARALAVTALADAEATRDFWFTVSLRPCLVRSHWPRTT